MKSPILFQALSEDLERERRRIISGDRSFNEPPNELYTQLFFVFKWDSTCSRLITAIELWEYGVRYWVQKTDGLRLRAETGSWDWEQRLRAETVRLIFSSLRRPSLKRYRENVRWKICDWMMFTENASHLCITSTRILNTVSSWNFQREPNDLASAFEPPATPLESRCT